MRAERPSASRPRAAMSLSSSDSTASLARTSAARASSSADTASKSWKMERGARGATGARCDGGGCALCCHGSAAVQCSSGRARHGYGRMDALFICQRLGSLRRIDRSAGSTGKGLRNDRRGGGPTGQLGLAAAASKAMRP
eukprot:357103-Chlamydomonas_euryale.AAC.1